jgi:hypothetical protein
MQTDQTTAPTPADLQARILTAIRNRSTQSLQATVQATRTHFKEKSPGDSFESYEARHFLVDLYAGETPTVETSTPEGYNVIIKAKPALFGIFAQVYWYVGNDITGGRKLERIYPGFTAKKMRVYLKRPFFEQVFMLLGVILNLSLCLLGGLVTGILVSNLTDSSTTIFLAGMAGVGLVDLAYFVGPIKKFRMWLRKEISKKATPWE